MDWKDRLADFVQSECRVECISERELASRISSKSGESVSYASIQSWRKKESNGLAHKSRKALAKYRGWSVVQLQAWLDGGDEPVLINNPHLSDIKRFLKTAPTEVAADIAALAHQRVMQTLAGSNGKLGAASERKTVSDYPSLIAKAIAEWQKGMDISDGQAEIYADNADLTAEVFRELKSGRKPTELELKRLARIVRKPNGKIFPLDELKKIAGNGTRR